MIYSAKQAKETEIRIHRRQAVEVERLREEAAEGEGILASLSVVSSSISDKTSYIDTVLISIDFYILFSIFVVRLFAKRKNRSKKKEKRQPN